ncbi:MAG: DUF6377 domain-containing protein [Bacteroidales bacterium]|jgi:flagellar biosynthesis chaperone FliJ|nr:DUF6377 domain-containing protein [Bacteroidales bacterium]
MRNIRYIFLIVILSIPALSYCREKPYSGTNDSLLIVLDSAISNKKSYEEKQRKKIDALLGELRHAVNDGKIFKIYGELFNAYKSFRVDSAFIIAEERIKAAGKLNRDSLSLAYMNLADVYNRTGLHYEAFEILDKIPRDSFVLHTPYYYYLYNSGYYYLNMNAISPDEALRYKKVLDSYRDTLLLLFPKNSFSYISNLVPQLINKGKIAEAEKIMEEHLKKGDIPTADKANFWITYSYIYKAKHNEETFEKCLIMASINDIRNAKKSYTSLQRLASLLFEKGDVDRAYNYIHCSLSDINWGKARSRLFDIADNIPIITSSYESEKDKEEKLYKALIYVTVILLTLLALALGFSYNKSKRLSESQESLHKKHRELSELNRKLSETNGLLKESNRTRVEYIGMLFDLFAQYIIGEENFKKDLIRGISTKQITDVASAIKDYDASQDKYIDFIKKFDSTFTSIFPDFVLKFNGLLKPGEQIALKDKNILSPELRIYALIKLGITDNTKISQFLRYSLQTVYNYRQKIRNKSLYNSFEFEKKVLDL